ncbi:MAG: glycerophosphodiester phosphodiesterase family protein [Pseudomonadota bacterium]
MTQPVPRPATEPTVVAHRGASGTAPENTISAMRAAKALGATWVEFDVTILGDGTPVVHHDATLDRTTNRTGRLADITRSDLAIIDAGCRFGEAFTGEPLPTFAELLDVVLDAGLSANIELKPHGASEATAKAVLARLDPGSSLADRVTISSFDHDALAVVRAASDTLPVSVLYKTPAPDYLDTLERLRAEALHIAHAAADAALVAAAREAGFPVRCFTVNDPQDAARLAQISVTGIFTDYPERFISDPAWSPLAACTQSTV